MTLINTQFNDCATFFSNLKTSFGGAIYIYVSEFSSSFKLNINNTSFSDVFAANSGGAIYLSTL